MRGSLRTFIGHWIVVLFVGAVVPGGFLLVTRLLDSGLNLPNVLPPPYNAFLAAFALIVGLFWMLWAYSFLHYVGKGSAVEAFGVALYPTRALVSTGPYAYTRNPMVFGELFVLLAIALYEQSLSGLVLIPVLAAFTIAYLRTFEEPGLVNRFGKQYEEYRDKVPVLIPKFG